MIYRPRYSNHNFFTAIYSAAALLFLQSPCYLLMPAIYGKLGNEGWWNLATPLTSGQLYRTGQCYQLYFSQLASNSKNAPSSWLLCNQQLVLERTVLLPSFLFFTASTAERLSRSSHDVSMSISSRCGATSPNNYKRISFKGGLNWNTHGWKGRKQAFNINTTE